MKRIALYGLILLISGCSSHAPKIDRVQGDWQVVTARAGSPDMLCYAGASPLKSGGTMGKRTGRPYLMVTRRTSGKMEVSASAGYPFMQGSKVELAVDDDTYDLFYKDGVAWARGDTEDMNIIEALKAAEDIELRAVSQAGLTSVDDYPSHGFALAAARLRQLCP
jgi:hypothetical protein